MQFKPDSSAVNTPKASTSTLAENKFHGASLINEEGIEVPITEDMVQEAFLELIDAWEVQRSLHNLPEPANDRRFAPRN